jgi:hypothetical protein
VHFVLYLTVLPSALLARILAHLALAAAAIRARPAALIRRLAGAAVGSLSFRVAHRAFCASPIFLLAAADIFRRGGAVGVSGKPLPSSPPNSAN